MKKTLSMSELSKLRQILGIPLRVLAFESGYSLSYLRKCEVNSRITPPHSIIFSYQSFLTECVTGKVPLHEYIYKKRGRQTSGGLSSAKERSLKNEERERIEEARTFLAERGIQC